MEILQKPLRVYLPLIILFFPKKTDLRKVSENRIKEVEKLLNYRPTRKFNYLDPVEVLMNKCVTLIGRTQPLMKKAVI